MRLRADLADWEKKKKKIETVLFAYSHTFRWSARLAGMRVSTARNESIVYSLHLHLLSFIFYKHRIVAVHL